MRCYGSPAASRCIGGACYTSACPAGRAGSGTGPGEAIIRTSLVRAALAWVGRGLDPAWVAQYALAELELRLGVAAGLILIDAAGRVGIAHSTEAMVAAYRTADGGRTVVVA